MKIKAGSLEKFAIVGKNKDKVDELRNEMEDYGFSYAWFKPEFVVCLGGHGTFFYAEYKYKGVPKLWIRDEDIVELFKQDKLRKFLEVLMMKKYNIKRLYKVEAEFKGGIIKGVNDIVIKGSDQRCCIRFRVKVGNKKVGDELVGDGVVISTVFGSSGYYKTVTKKRFKKGLGVGFINLVFDRKGLSFNDKFMVEFDLIRGEALVSADNCPKMFKVDEGYKVLIRKSKDYASLIEV